ncbi:hypothetical protein KIN20_009429, partial [Parelaphostrongylus tenuis]
MDPTLACPTFARVASNNASNTALLGTVFIENAAICSLYGLFHISRTEYEVFPIRLRPCGMFQLCSKRCDDTEVQSLSKRQSTNTGDKQEPQAR